MAEHDSDGTGSPEMSKVTGRKQSNGKEERRRLQSFKGWPGNSRKLRCGLHRASATPKRPRPRLERRRKKRRQCSFGGEHCSHKLQKCHSPKIHKLLSNFHNNSKISKNKSCSKSKVLQLCFWNHIQIHSTFWNSNLNSKGDTFKELCLFKLLQILLNNFENSKNQLCTTWQDLHFCF